MIKAVLLDLDDTLVRTDGQAVFAQHMRLISPYVADVARPEAFVTQALVAMQASRDNIDPTTTIGEAFYRTLHKQLGCPPNSLVPIFQRFYENGMNDRRLSVWPQPGASELLNWLFERGYVVVVAADPALHRQTIQQYLRLGGLPSHDLPFSLSGGLDSIHFSKPHPHYFEEILARIDVKPDEALMVGDHWQSDIKAAARTGLNTFWVTEQPANMPADDMGTAADGHGTLETLLQLVRDEGWLEELSPREASQQDYSAYLLGMLAAIDGLLRETEANLWTQAPEAEAWSARDTLCHLRDHETEVDQPRLQQVLEADNPFISATDYDPLAHTGSYATQDARAALHTFARRRSETIAMLDALDEDDWERPARHSIFGPTTLREMVRFMADHDRIHLRQMRDALAAARQPTD